MVGIAQSKKKKRKNRINGFDQTAETRIKIKKKEVEQIL